MWDIILWVWLTALVFIGGYTVGSWVGTKIGLWIVRRK
jgi:hypothetical protein